jgi:DNA-directed RNA polymerase subunit RPC12/RpoP
MEGAKPRHHVPRHFPTKCTFGRLRITRVGNEARLWAAAGDSKDFEELWREELGPEDVTLVRLNAYPGHRQNELDIRLKDLRVRGLRPNEAAALLALPAPLEGRTGKSEKGWLAVTLAGGIAVPLLAALIIGGVLYLRRRKTSAVIIPPNALLPIACPGCGKKLKVKPDLAGKKVRCGQCGKAVLVAGRKDA